ncbi:hypothetical protein EDD21DRAFT_128862 [Dissophora ornata]|nr:hypothetical protein EDD21DRAFT_128862 [Dissophora ornata]
MMNEIRTSGPQSIGLDSNAGAVQNSSGENTYGAHMPGGIFISLKPGSEDDAVHNNVDGYSPPQSAESQQEAQQLIETPEGERLPASENSTQPVEHPSHTQSRPTFGHFRSLELSRDSAGGNPVKLEEDLNPLLAVANGKMGLGSAQYNHGGDNSAVNGGAAVSGNERAEEWLGSQIDTKDQYATSRYQGEGQRGFEYEQNDFQGHNGYDGHSGYQAAGVEGTYNQAESNQEGKSRSFRSTAPISPVHCNMGPQARIE